MQNLSAGNAHEASPRWRRCVPASDRLADAVRLALLIEKYTYTMVSSDLTFG